MIEEPEQIPEVTAAMRANLARLQSALYEWLVKEEILGDAAFYTIEAWRGRREEYLTDSFLVLTFDGSTLHTMLNFGGDTDEFDDLVESFGFFYELGNHWNLGFYPQDGYDYSRSVGTYTSKLRDPRWQKKADAVNGQAEAFLLKPDITVWHVGQDGAPAGIGRIVDAKWKRLNPRASDFGVDGSDVYQLLTYALRYGCTSLELAYPQPVGIENFVRPPVFKLHAAGLVGSVTITVKLVPLWSGKGPENDHVTTQAEVA